MGGRPARAFAAAVTSAGVAFGVRMQQAEQHRGAIARNALSRRDYLSELHRILKPVNAPIFAPGIPTRFVIRSLNTQKLARAHATKKSSRGASITGGPAR